VKAPTRDQALVLWSQFRQEIAGPATADEASKEPPTFRLFMESYGERIATRKKPGTQRTHRSILETRLLPTFGDVRLDRISSSNVADFAVVMKIEGFSAAYIQGCVRLLKALLREAVERDVLRQYPLTKKIALERPKLPALELSPEERERFLAAFNDEAGFRTWLERTQRKGKLACSPHFHEPRVFGGGINPASDAATYYFQRFRSFKPIFVLALETGLRKGDLMALEWNSVDTKNGWIRVTMQKTSREAVIPITEDCELALIELRARNHFSALVCVTEDGAPVSETTRKRYFALAKTLAGITRRFRFHDLRHTFGSTLASEGVSLQIIQKALGHSSVEMSERYARPSVAALSAIKDALERSHRKSRMLPALAKD
ncbi:MAG: tyrosine-type recombinase/integrase, partial [Thermoanaerobaculia bacterium]